MIKTLKLSSLHRRDKIRKFFGTLHEAKQTATLTKILWTENGGNIFHKNDALITKDRFYYFKVIIYATLTHQLLTIFVSTFNLS